MEDLARSDAPGEMRGSLTETASSIDSLTTVLLDRPVFGTRVGVVGELGRLVIANHIRGALRSEFRERGDVIRRALEAQAGLLEAVTAGVEGDIARGAQLSMSRRVTDPFVAGAVVGERATPAAQDARIAARRSMVLVPLVPEELRAASNAAGDLRRAYERVAAGGGDSDLRALAWSLAALAQAADRAGGGTE